MRHEVSRIAVMVLIGAVLALAGQRAWLFLGVIAAALAMAGFFYVLLTAGWRPGDPTGSGTPLHHAYQQATTMTFLGLVAGQIGTAFAARTEYALAAATPEAAP